MAKDLRSATQKFVRMPASISMVCLKKQGRETMYLIEYLSTPAGQPPTIYTELALGSTPEEAMDQADTHLPKMATKFGAQGYRIIDSNKQCVGIGPEGFLSTQRS
ncbi:hypothetical protein [Hyphomicrobium sp.]|uniref:hypothetical protein n=1 Tax=Hyphomicrobium sp. TaxID=82 RepID=UPI001DF5E992|nr:hypothetical protein [Hyphomicrobium sp.]MBY0559803.1 hypothetical protein [Hyphomicrobium sp.]